MSEATMKVAGGMSCPRCQVGLLMTDREGIEIDYCPQCRGVWLDRGELDKIIERAAQYQPGAGQNTAQSGAPQSSPWTAPAVTQPAYGHSGQPRYDQGHHGGNRHGGNSFLGRLFGGH